MINYRLVSCARQLGRCIRPRYYSSDTKIEWPAEWEHEALGWQKSMPSPDTVSNLHQDPFYQEDWHQASSDVTRTKFISKKHDNATIHFSKYIENSGEFISVVMDELSSSNKNPVKSTDLTTFATEQEQKTRKSYESYMLPTLEGLLEAGVHMGHSYTQGNQKAKPFIFGKRYDSHIIDLEKTLACLKRAMMVAMEISSLGGVILFLGSKEFLSRAVCKAAQVTGQFYMQQDHPWKLGTLTNREEVLRKSVSVDGTVFNFPASQTWGKGHEAPLGPLELYRQRGKFQAENPLMDRSQQTSADGQKQPQVLLPDLVVILDGASGEVAMRESLRALVPTIGIIDTNMDPNLVTYPIPGNDDALSSIEYILNCIVAAILRGKDKLLMSGQSGVERSHRTASRSESKFEFRPISQTSKYKPL